MKNIIIKKFIRSEDRNRAIKFAGAFGIISNLIIAVLKFIAGTISGSVSIISDGMNNISDSFSSIISIIGIKLSERPEDPEHPYGHARYEYISGIIVSILIIILGCELFSNSVRGFFVNHTLHITGTTLIILMISIVVKFWQYIVNKSLGEEFESKPLIAVSKDSRNDILITTSVIISVLVEKYTNIGFADNLMGFILAIYIIISGMRLVIETASPLIGEKPNDELIDALIELGKNEKEVLGVHDIIIHNYGVEKYFASMHIEVNDTMNIVKAHEIADELEQKAQKQLNIILVIHVDPLDLKSKIILDLDKKISCILRSIEEKNIEIKKAAFHDLRIVAQKEVKNIVFDLQILPNTSENRKKALSSIKKVLEADDKYKVHINFDRSYANNR